MPQNSRFSQRDVTWRTGGPSVHAPGDGLEGAYSAVLHTAPSGGTCKVIVPALSLTQPKGAFCSQAFTGSVGDVVLVMFDENKEPWVLSPSGVALASPTWHPLTYATGTGTGNWSDFGSGWDPGEYALDSLGFVHLHGMVTNATAVSYPTVNTLIATLPIGFRPKTHLMFTGGFEDSVGNHGAPLIQILTSGQIQMYGKDVGVTGGNNGTYRFLTLTEVVFRQGN